jgi:hypothetical protein
MGASLAPASAQWLGPPPEGPIPPGSIVRSLMNRGFIDIGPPRFDGEVYVVDGVNARGTRLRLVIDAYDGSLISRARLDAPLLPPGAVGRGRMARVEPFGEYHGPSFDEEEIAPRRWHGPPVDRDALPPPPAARRAERIEPPMTEPRRPERATPPAQRQAKKPEPAPAKAKKPEPQAVPPAPPSAIEAAKPEMPKEPPAATAAVPAPAWKEPPVEPKPAAASAKPQDASPRSVRVIEGITRMGPQSRDALDLPKPDVPPPVTLD